MEAPRVLIVAGEASGDAHGAGLVRALRERGLAASFYGIGGSQMDAAGVRLLARYDELAVVGLFEVLGRLPRVLRLMRRIRREIRQNPPDLFLPIDAPDFNLRLCRSAWRKHVPVVYFVAPQLWAWRAGRVRALRRYVRELLVLFPFEERWFTSRGVRTSYVGHPLVEAAGRRLGEPVQAQEHPGGGGAEKLRGLLLPGSRRGEIRRHMPVLAAAAARLCDRFPSLCWTLRMAPGLDEGFYRAWPLGEKIELSREPIFDLAAAADVAVAASGTASFEVALMGTPVLVVYRVNPLTWILARLLVRVPWISMANLAAGKPIVPELVQHDFSPERVVSEIASLLEDGPRRERMRSELAVVRGAFGPPGAFGRAAERIMSYL